MYKVIPGKVKKKKKNPLKFTSHIDSFFQDFPLLDKKQSQTIYSWKELHGIKEHPSSHFFIREKNTFSLSWNKTEALNVKTQLKSPTKLSSITVSVTLSQFNIVTQQCLTLCDPMDCSTPGFPVHHQLPELAQTYVHQVGDAIQLSHPLSSPSPPAFNLSQHQGLFQRVSSSHQVAKVLEFQLQQQSSQ